MVCILTLCAANPKTRKQLIAIGQRPPKQFLKYPKKVVRVPPTLGSATAVTVTITIITIILVTTKYGGPFARNGPTMVS